MTEKGMQILHKRNLLPDIKQIDLDLCEHYVYGKQRESDFLELER
jgi:hypothetical protein